MVVKNELKLDREINEGEGPKLGLAIRDQFPIFSKNKVSPLHYLDSAASAQKPSCVIDRISTYLSTQHANIHRGAYELSASATNYYDQARAKVAQFVGATRARDVIFTKGATEAINLVASALQNQFKPGDTIAVTLLEHHSNIVPWQLLAKRANLNIEWINITDHAQLDLEDFSRVLKEYKPKLVALTQVSNSFGTVLPVNKLIEQAHSHGAFVLVDAAQAIQHISINVSESQVDFLVFSGHKMYGPTGIGGLYVSPKVVDLLEPYQGGGDMISMVSIEGSEWAEPPAKFEAGTPPIAEAIALGEAVDFINSVGLKNIKNHEEELFIKAWHLLLAEKDLILYGAATILGAESGMQSSIIPFNMKGVHPHDLSTVVDSNNVQIRAGHHCAMPALKRLGIQASARASIGMYSDISDFEALLDGIGRARKVFQ